MKSRVRLITLNLKGMDYNWLEERRDAAVSGLREFAPDVVCFQETTIRHEGGFYHQAKDLGRALGLTKVAFSPYGNPIEVASGDEGGVAFVTRWPILEVRNRQLIPGPQATGDARVALLLTVDSPLGELHLVGTHLSWRPEEKSTRLMQMSQVLADLAARGWSHPGVRTVLCGDLNATEDEPAIVLAHQHLQDAFRTCHAQAPGYTWSGKNPLTTAFPSPDRRLDYILCPQGAAVHEAKVILNHPAPVFASDHFGVFAELEWLNRENGPDLRNDNE